MFSGCEGDTPGAVTDGGLSERPTAAGGMGGGIGGSGGATGGRGGATGGADARPTPDTPPPVPNPTAVKILPGQTDLLGSFQNGCTFGPGGERWCAVSRPLSLSRRELWFVNVSKAAANRSLVSMCDQQGLCVKASDNLYTAQPDVGPAYPQESARASGNSFIYLTDPISAPSDAFEGDVWIHTVGAPSATQIGDNVFDCAVAGQRYIDFGKRVANKVVGICAGNPSSPAGAETNFFTLLGGTVPGQDVPATPLTTLPTKMAALLPTVQTIYPIHPATMASRWRVGFTSDGETLVLSAGGAGVNDIERLTTVKTDDIGKAGIMPTPMPGGDNATRWTITADGTKIYYFKDYNYNADGNQSGTLHIADFPAGTNPRPLMGSRVPGGATGGVGAYRVLVNEAGLDSGVGILSRLTMGQGDYSVIRNPAGSLDDMANVVSVTQGTRSLPLPSPNLRFSLFARTFAMNTPTSDIWVVGNDGSMDCRLSTGELGGVFGFPFTRTAGIMFWADNYDEATFAADGWLTDPADCRNVNKKRNFAKGVDFWFVDAERLLLYSDESNGAQVSLKYAYVNGTTLGPPVTIQTRADRIFHIILDAQPADGSPARFKGITYKLGGGSEDVNGIYYYEIPPPGSAPPTPDAAAGN